ncbi:MAG: putative TrmH family tRNA/rRNA methyltransferase [Firmicutes bacterium ADurb.Bin182]|nr:MAG: putative TrmH family tRNA/rRNA methyltransferase [Firmicutes bacterium ADurb.Bin182]
MIIESTRNERVKNAAALFSRKGRLEQGCHLIEGEKLVNEAILSGAVFKEAFIEEGHDPMRKALENAGANVFLVTRAVMEKLTFTKTPQYVCASVITPETEAPDVYPAGLIVALDAVSDPGNLGTIIRTADAFGASGILLGSGCADPFAPKPVRAAMGSTFHIPVWHGELDRETDKLAEQGFTLVCGHLKGEETPLFPGNKCAVIIGNESSGVSEGIAMKCFRYRLTMYGRAESLNASVAAGIIIYEFLKAMR